MIFVNKKRTSLFVVLVLFIFIIGQSFVISAKPENTEKDTKNNNKASSECKETRPNNPPRGSLKKVDRSTWGANGVSNNVTMNIYVPGLLSANPPVVMSCHSCGNNAAGQVSNNKNMVAAADKYGFIMICFEKGVHVYIDKRITQSLGGTEFTKNINKKSL